jgi:feruloyl esterase
MATFRGLPIDGLAVQSVVRMPAGGFWSPRAYVLFPDMPPFCRVLAKIASGESVIMFEVWVPDEWNRKIVSTGNGGYSNMPNFGDMAYALSQGYAVVGGDTGHQTATPDDLEWGAGHPERILDWGTRSIHITAAPAKWIVAQLAGRAPQRAYYYGCSTAGHQGYAEMQRYPQDFDGIIAGAPANNRVRLNVGFLWQFLANHERGANGNQVIPASKLPVITKAVVAACDGADGVTDGVVDDPRACRFDPGIVECKAADGPGSAVSLSTAGGVLGSREYGRCGELHLPASLMCRTIRR